MGGKKNNKDAPTTTSLVWSLSFGAQSICCHFWKKVRFSFTTHQQWYCKYWLSIQSVSQSFFYWTLEGIFICWDLVRWATLIIGLGRAWLQTNTWESGGWVGVVVCALNAEKVDKCGGRDNNNNSSILGFVVVCRGLYTTSGVVLCSHVFWKNGGCWSEEEIVFIFNFTEIGRRVGVIFPFVVMKYFW